VFAAQTKGKIPSELANAEDLLTSSVFGFLNYADRRTYLRAFVKLLDLDLAPRHLDATSFEFWPVYETGTEPDLVIRAGKYYVLVESKYRTIIPSVRPTRGSRSQLDREALEGNEAAEAEGREFLLVVITAAFRQLTNPYRNMSRSVKAKVPRTSRRWLNWRDIYAAMESIVEERGEARPDLRMSTDFMAYMDRLNLRAFRGFDSLSKVPDVPEVPAGVPLFLDVEVSDRRREFEGFGTFAADLEAIPRPPRRLFYLERPPNMSRRRGQPTRAYSLEGLPEVPPADSVPLFFEGGPDADPQTTGG